MSMGKHFYKYIFAFLRLPPILIFCFVLFLVVVVVNVTV